MKHKLKFLLTYTAILFTICISLGAAAAGEEVYPKDCAYTEAKSVIGALLEGFDSGKDINSEVTRAEFVDNVSKLFKYGYEAAQKTGYADVGSDYYAADSIYNALENGWVSAAENFYPENPITYVQALKTAVHAAKYETLAINGGGWMSGYITAANTEGLDKNISLDAADNLTFRDMTVLLYNMLNADEVRTTVRNGRIEYFKTGSDYLWGLYSVNRLKGLVTETEKTSVYASVDAACKYYLHIDGEAYPSYENHNELIGLYVTAFVKEENGENTIIVAAPNNYAAFEIDSDDFENISGDYFNYYGSKRTYKARLNPSYHVIYNGKSVESFDKVKDKITDGEIRLIDNDNDGKYDYIVITNYRYISVSSINAVKKIIGDKNSSDNSLMIEDKDTDCTVYDTNGEEKTFFDINVGNLLAIKESADGKLIDIYICKESISGTITSVSDDTIEIDNTAYRMAHNLKGNYGKDLKGGSYGIVLLGINGKAAAFMTSEGEYSYGYLIRAYVPDTNPDDVMVKLFTISGKTETYRTRSKVRTDGETKKNSELLKMINAKGAQTVRYALNGGELSGLDFYEDYDINSTLETDLPKDNSLLRFTFPGVSEFHYRSSVKGCMPYFNADGSAIFKIPENLSQEEYFVCGGSELLVNDTKYSNIEIFDISESGTAGVIVMKYDPINEDYLESDMSCMVEKVYETVNEDDEAIIGIECWAAGEYRNIYLPKDKTVKKDSGNGLVPGDIIRVKLNGKNEIISINVEIDMSDGTPKQNSTASAAFFGSNVAVTYQMGYVYSLSGKNAYLTNSKDDFGNIDYSFKKLKNFSVNTKNIVSFDMDKKDVRPIDLSEIKTYRNFGAANDFAVIRQSRFAANTIFVYSSQNGD